MNDNVKNGLVDALNGVLDFKGVIARDLETGAEIDFNKGEDKIETMIRGDEYFGCHMVTYVLMNMIKDCKVDIICDENDKDYMYLCKLLEEDEGVKKAF